MNRLVFKIISLPVLVLVLTFVGCTPPQPNDVVAKFGDVEIYVSDLTKDIMMLEDKAPQYWIHGHVHNSFDYMIGETNVLTNPRGYVGIYSADRPENAEFDPNKEFEL